MSEWLQSQNIQNIAISLGIFAFAVIISLLVRLILSPILRRVTARTNTDLDDILVKALRRPVAWGILLAGAWIALRRVWNPTRLEDLDKGAAVLGVLLLVSAALRTFNTVAAWWSQRAAAKSDHPREVMAQSVVGHKIISITILVLGILIILTQLGVKIGPLLGALGIGGLAVALALQDTLSNLFAGIYMMVDRPVTVGDFIKLESGEEGFVEEIGWRNTKVRMWANNIVIIPNSKLSQSVLTNYYLPHQEMSVYVRCGVAYDSDLEHVERVCVEVTKEVMARVEGSATDWQPAVRFKEFADFSINFVVVLRVTDFAAQYLLAHEYVKALHRRFDHEGIEIPFPIRTVIMHPPTAKAPAGLEKPEVAGSHEVEVGEGDTPVGAGG
ncbi:MAG: mechanosensitive ion channel family protein [Armatimonadetes bacterium]|nr:mechanosensitive ion channel family protein [Armatimonadota bacterium]